MEKLLLCILSLFTWNLVVNAQPCTPLGDETSYGTSDTWIGYVYNHANLTDYRGYVAQGSPGNPAFDQSFGGDNVSYATNGCPTQTETFSVRYRLRKTFTSGTYDFTVGGDDGFRLSLDGGATWLINRWNDQGYTTVTQSATLNGSYDMVLEYYENSGGNRVSFGVVLGCSGSENPATYGSADVWRGYVYDGVNFNSYKGMVQEGSLGAISFDQQFGGNNASYPTSGCAVQTETFSVRYRLRKNFTSSSYTFIVGGDDGYRLSFDGGATWVINRWNDQSYNTTSYTTNLNGTYDMVLEYYENGGDNRINFTMQANIILGIQLLNFKGIREEQSNSLHWKISADSDPVSFTLERSSNRQQFQSLSQVPARTGQQEYMATDPNPGAGTNFYRLKMTDREGKITYSFILALIATPGGIDKVKIYPTILRENLLYCQSDISIRIGLLKIIDLNGRVVMEQKLGVVGKGQTIGIYLEKNFPARGMYVLALYDGTEILLTKRVISE